MKVFYNGKMIIVRYQDSIMPASVAEEVGRMFRVCFSGGLEPTAGLDTFVLFLGTGRPAAFLSYEHRYGTIWNVCKDLKSPTAHAADTLLTLFLRAAPEMYNSRKRMKLVVELGNPFLKRAMNLYLRHGFKPILNLRSKSRVIQLVRKC